MHTGVHTWGGGEMGHRIGPGQTGLLILGTGEGGSTLHRLCSQPYLMPWA
jgi:hypothetical protein